MSLYSTLVHKHRQMSYVLATQAFNISHNKHKDRDFRNYDVSVQELSYRLYGPEFETKQEKTIFLFSETPRPAVGLTKPLIQGHRGITRGKAAEARGQPLTSAEFQGKERVELYLCFPYMPSQHGQGKLYLCIYVSVDTASKRISFHSTLQLKMLHTSPTSK